MSPDRRRRPDPPWRRRRFEPTTVDEPVEATPMSGALDRVLRGFGTPGIAAVRTIFSAWDELVGPELAPHARPASLDRACLLVVVDSPAWATRFRYEQATLLQRVADELGPGVLERIDIRVRTAPAP